MNAAAPPERIAVGAGGTTIWVGEGLLADASRYLVSPSGRFLLVSAAPAREAAAAVRRALGGRAILDLVVGDGEADKSLATVESIADAALAAGLRRDDAFVAVGGGVCTDVVGFAAAVLLRGVAWNAVPTTTAGMADAAIGGKTAVNHTRGKNLLGAFHPPRTVLSDPGCLGTLPDRDYRAGLVEAFKAAWIADRDLARRAESGIEALRGRDESVLLDVVAGAAEIKARIVTEDFKEGDRRRLLNFGHTLGHAFEAAGGYRELRHGEAVAWGIAAALEISRRRAGLSAEEADRVRSALSRLGPFPGPCRDRAVLASFLGRDKKFTARGTAGVLLEAVGRGRVFESVAVEEWLDAAQIASLTV